MTEKPQKPDTTLIHVGADRARNMGVVNTPVVRGSTYLFENMEEVRAANRAVNLHHEKAAFYGRKGLQTHWTLEEAITELEQGHDTVLTPSGLSACTLALMSYGRSGGHVLVADNVYEPTRHFCDTLFKQYGVETTYYDPKIGAGIVDLMADNTCLVFCESPGSHTFDMQDIPAISKAVHDKNPDCVVIIDNTWGAGYFHKPLLLGADVSVQAATKYIVGHSDALVGSITTTEPHFATLWEARRTLGFALSPDDAYLATRGLRTMAVRLDRHYENALVVAKWLQTRTEVKRVLFPALPEDPGHDIWKRDFTGACGLFGVVFNQTSTEAVHAFIHTVELFGLGFSWGGYESLICPSNPSKARPASGWDEPEPGIRLHIGLEDPQDLIDDLSAGLDAFNTALASA